MTSHGTGMVERLMGARYDAGQLIGVGAFGQVYQARDSLLDRSVAIKVIPLSGPRTEETARLLGEARAGAAAGPAAVAVHDVLTDSAGIGIVMELIGRGSLVAAVRAGAKRERGLALALATVRSAAQIHRQGVLHLDLHPGNLLLRDDDSVAVGDFGLAQFTRSVGLSRGGHEKSWTAPELLNYGVGSPQADVFALGLVLGWIGRRTGLDYGAVVERATRDDPRDRHANADDLLSDLMVASTAIVQGSRR